MKVHDGCLKENNSQTDHREPIMPAQGKVCKVGTLNPLTTHPWTLPICPWMRWLKERATGTNFYRISRSLSDHASFNPIEISVPWFMLAAFIFPLEPPVGFPSIHNLIVARAKTLA